jgi:uncharacterized protein with WD repeat
MAKLKKVQRTKRPDSRPSAKAKRRRLQAQQESKSVEEIKVTRTKSSEKKEPEVSGELKDPLDDDAKYLRQLRKKLRSIEALLVRQENGEALDSQQLIKIEKADSLIEEIEKLEAAQSEASEDDEEGSEE